MAKFLYEVANEFIEHLSKVIDKEIEEEMRKVRNRIGNSNVIYVCKDNNRIYRRRPRRCKEHAAYTLNEYLNFLRNTASVGNLSKLSIWRWIKENRLAIPVKNHYLCCMSAYFENGYLVVTSNNVAFCFKDVATAAKYVTELKKLANAPFRVAIYIDEIDALKSLSIEDVLKLIEECSGASPQKS